MNGPITRRGALAGAVATATASALGLDVARASEPTVHDVKIMTFKFEPAHIDVKVGDVIRWTNHDLATHTATANEFGWDTGELASGKSMEIEVTEGMETSYFCVFHPHMMGTLKIA